MKASIILAVVSVLAAKVSAKCWSEDLGFKCCSDDNLDVYFVDDDGEWGVENGDWCGMPTEVSEEKPEVKESYATNDGGFGGFGGFGDMGGFGGFGGFPGGGNMGGMGGFGGFGGFPGGGDMGGFGGFPGGGDMGGMGGFGGFGGFPGGGDMGGMGGFGGFGGFPGGGDMGGFGGFPGGGDMGGMGGMGGFGGFGGFPGGGDMGGFGGFGGGDMGGMGGFGGFPGGGDMGGFGGFGGGDMGGFGGFGGNNDNAAGNTDDNTAGNTADNTAGNTGGFTQDDFLGNNDPNAGANQGNSDYNTTGAEGSDVDCSSKSLKSNTTLNINGRKVIVQFPSGFGSKAAPLLINYHPIMGSAQQWSGGSQTAKAALADGAVVAFMDGAQGPMGQAWNVGPCCTDADDVQFTRDFIKEITAKACIDPKRIYAAGFSMGGGMSNYAGCYLADVIAAAAPSAFDLAKEITSAGKCKPARPFPILNFRGTQDNVVMYNGGLSQVVAGKPITFLGAKNNFAEWAKMNGCSGQPKANTPGNGCEMYEDCEGGAKVGLCTINGGGHSEGDGKMGWNFLKQFSL